MTRTVSTFAIATLFACVSLACGGDNNRLGVLDTATACTELCTSSGFTGGNAEVFEHEVNCFCSGGNGSAHVTAAACTQTCADLGWSAGEAFSASACQCN